MQSGSAIDDGRMTLREGPLLRGTVELQEQGMLTVRLAEGLTQLGVADRFVDVPQGTAIAVVVERLKLYPTGI